MKMPDPGICLLNNLSKIIVRVVCSRVFLLLLSGSFFIAAPAVKAKTVERERSISNQAESVAVINAITQLDSLRARARANGEIPIISRLNVSFKAERTLSIDAVEAQRNAISNAGKAVIRSMAGKNVTNVKNFETVPLLAMTVNENALLALSKNPMVGNIEEDIAVPPSLAESVVVIGADTAWSAGFDGAGWAVAVLDTGVDKNHEFLSGKVVSEACYSTNGRFSSSLCPGGVSFSTSDDSGSNCSLAIDGCRHGTHVAGIIAGKQYTPDGPGYSGVARGAGIIAVQVFSEFSGGTCTDLGLSSPCALTYTSDQIRGLERVYALRAEYNIAAVNMSLGGGEYTSNCDGDSRKPVIDNLRAAGIATVVSSGNSYSRNAISAPACISSAISVGATCDSAAAGFGCAAVDDIPNYSNVASFISLLAPGSIISSSTPGVNQFRSWHGTSMAAPHVAAAWALMKQDDPAASVSAVLAALKETGTVVDDQRSSGSVTGMKRINVDLNLVPQLAAPTFTYPLGGELLVGGTTARISWNTNYTAPVLSDDMESGLGLWTVSHGSGAVDWTLDTGNPRSGQNALFAGGPDNVSDQYISSTELLMLPDNAQLRFWHSYNTQASQDGGVIELSTDGLTWNDLGPLITRGGYDSTIASATDSPIAGRQAFSGDSGGYVETLVDLDSYAGQAVYIRFRMASDSTIASSGWYIDDVVLLESTAPPDLSYDLAYSDDCAAPADWTPVGVTPAWVDYYDWVVPMTASDGYCIRVEAVATGFTASPQVTSSTFTVDLDSDDDRLLDGEEILLGTDPHNPDSDGDGLQDGDEVLIYGTLPLNADTDADGFNDGLEVQYGSDPFSSADTPANGDVTEDGLTNTGDLVVCTRIAVGDIQAPSEQQIMRCDIAPVDNVTDVPQPDGKVDAGDLAQLIRRILVIED